MKRNPLPPTPIRRSFGRPPPAPRRPLNTLERTRRITREHEDKERPFDPERPGSWRGSSRDLVVNPRRPRLTQNPDGFYEDLSELVSRYHRTLRTDMTEAEFTKTLFNVLLNEEYQDALQHANQLLEGHGVEALGPVNQHDGPPYLYINFGETYEPTIMWSRDDRKIFVAMGGWGQVWEDEGEPNLFDEAWSNWLAREFEQAITSDLWAEFGSDSITEAKYDELLEFVQDLDQDQLLQLFRKAMSLAQDDRAQRKYPEILVESEGIHVLHMDVVVDHAVKMVLRGWKPRT